MFQPFSTLDGIFIVAKGARNQHKEELAEGLGTLGRNRHKLSKKSEWFQTGSRMGGPKSRQRYFTTTGQAGDKNLPESKDETELFHLWGQFRKIQNFYKTCRLT